METSTSTGRNEASAAPAASIKTSFGRLATALSIGMLGYYIAIAIPSLLLLTFKMMQVAPNNVTASFGVASGVGSLVGMIMGALGGAIADRTRTRFGRRRLWILLGSILGSASFIGIDLAQTVGMVVLFWSLINFFFVFALSSYYALIPEQVEPVRQGTFSGIIGIFNPVGITIGMILMTILTDASLSVKWYTLAGIGAVGGIIACLLVKEGLAPLSTQSKKPKGTLSDALSRAYPSPRKYPSFTWGMITRFFASLGFFTIIFNTLFLIDRFGYTEDNVTGIATLFQGTQTLCLALSSVIGGYLSDKYRKQKPFVAGAAVLVAAGLITMAYSPTVAVAMIGNGILGLGYGMYLAVDTALIARILPYKEDAAKDYGIMNIATGLPNALSALIAPILIASGGFVLFYGVFAVSGLLSAAAVAPIPEMSPKPSEQSTA